MSVKKLRIFYLEESDIGNLDIRIDLHLHLASSEQTVWPSHFIVSRCYSAAFSAWPLVSRAAWSMPTNLALSREMLTNLSIYSCTSGVISLLISFDIIPFAAPSYSVSRHAAHKDTSKPTTDEQKPQPPQQKNLHTGSCWGEGHWCLYDMEFPEDKSLKCICIIHIELGGQNICGLSAK